MGLPERVTATYFGGLRLITPPDRTVRAFVAAAAGLATYKGTTLSYPDFLPSRYYTENRGIWAVGGGLSTMVGERWAGCSYGRIAHASFPTPRPQRTSAGERAMPAVT